MWNCESNEKEKEGYLYGMEIFGSKLIVCQPVQILGSVL